MRQSPVEIGDNDLTKTFSAQESVSVPADQVNRVYISSSISCPGSRANRHVPG